MCVLLAAEETSGFDATLDMQKPATLFAAISVFPPPIDPIGVQVALPVDCVFGTSKSTSSGGAANFGKHTSRSQSLDLVGAVHNARDLEEDSLWHEALAQDVLFDKLNDTLPTPLGCLTEVRKL